MNNQNKFIGKLLDRLDKIDRSTLESHLLHLQREQKRTYDILNALPYGIIVLDAARSISYCNDAVKELFMKSHFQKIDSLASLIDDSALLTFINDSCEPPQYIEHHRIDVLSPRERTLSVSLIPSFNETDERLHHVLIVLEDLFTYEQMLHKNRALNIESLIKLTAGIAHEIGNPLNTIKIYLELLRSELTTSQQNKALDLLAILSDETNRLDAIVRNFLKATRTGMPLFKKGSVVACISRALHFVQPELTHARIELTTHFDKNIPLFFINQDMLYQAFLNIIKNAIEAMPDGGTITVTAAAKESIVSITFKDSGSGIDKKDLPHVFDAYMTTKPNGSGLGLMNVHTIISAHRGRVELRSTKNKGTSVIITLPVLRDTLQLPQTETA